jgi:hypothetical protein
MFQSHVGVIVDSALALFTFLMFVASFWWTRGRPVPGHGLDPIPPLGYLLIFTSIATVVLIFGGLIVVHALAIVH